MAKRKRENRGKRIKKAIQRLLEGKWGSKILGGGLRPALTLLVILSCTAPQFAQAAGGHCPVPMVESPDHGHKWCPPHKINMTDWGKKDAPSVVSHLISFLIVIGGGFFILKKSLPESFANRSKAIADRIEESQKAYKEAKSHYDHYKGKLENLSQESEALLAGAKTDGEKEKQFILDNANKYASQLKVDSESFIAREVKEAEHHLKTDLVQDVLTTSNGKLKNILSAEKQNELLESAITRLEKGFQLQQLVNSEGAAL